MTFEQGSAAMPGSGWMAPLMEVLVPGPAPQLWVGAPQTRASGHSGVTEAFSFLSPSLSPLLAVRDTFPSHVWTSCYSSCVAWLFCTLTASPPSQGTPWLPCPCSVQGCSAIYQSCRDHCHCTVHGCFYPENWQVTLCWGCSGSLSGFLCRGKSQFLHCHCPQPHRTPQCWVRGSGRSQSPAAASGELMALWNIPLAHPDTVGTSLHECSE